MTVPPRSTPPAPVSEVTEPGVAASELDPVVAQFVDSVTRPEDLAGLSIAERRTHIRQVSDANFSRYGAPGPEVARIVDRHVPVQSGQVVLRLYYPSQQPRLPIHLAVHGGGWWHGSIDELVVDATCRWRCRHTGAVVAAVEYRLSPEHRHPTPLEDVYATLTWLADNAARLGLDPERLTIGGASAGANLAAAACLLARQRSGPRVACQLLEVPVLDLDHLRLTSSHDRPRLDRVDLDDSHTREAVDHYLGPHVDARDPTVSPLLAADLSGMPPTHVITAEHDTLRPDGEQYVARLHEAGVPATVAVYPGAIHSSGYLTGVWAPATRWRDDADRILAAACRPPQHDTGGPS